MSYSNSFEIQNPGGSAPYVFMVEHARNYIPPHLKNLGVSPEDLQKHVAYDIGIEGVTHKLSDLLNVPTIYCTHSRLIIDANRSSDHAQFILTESDGIAIPGNIGLHDAEKQARIDGIFKPFHEAAHGMIAEAMAINPQRFLIGMHSCTDRLQGGAYREWPIGLSTYGDDDVMRAFAKPFEEMGMAVGFHKPYDVRNYSGVSLDMHGRQAGRPHLLVEIRQDLIRDEAGQERWAEIMAKALNGFAPTIPFLYPASPPPAHPVHPSP